MRRTTTITRAATSHTAGSGSVDCGRPAGSSILMIVPTPGSLLALTCPPCLVHDRFDHREAEAAPGRCDSSWRWTPRETIDDVRQALRGMPSPESQTSITMFRILGRPGQLRCAFRRRERQGVDDRVVEGLFDAKGSASNALGVRAEPPRRARYPSCDTRAHAERSTSLNELGHRHLLAVQLDAAGFVARGIDGSPITRRSRCASRSRDGELLPPLAVVDRDLVHAQRLEMAEHRGQRRHELVRHVRDQLPPSRSDVSSAVVRRCSSSAIALNARGYLGDFVAARRSQPAWRGLRLRAFSPPSAGAAAAL